MSKAIRCESCQCYEEGSGFYVAISRFNMSSIVGFEDCPEMHQFNVCTKCYNLIQEILHKGAKNDLS